MSGRKRCDEGAEWTTPAPKRKSRAKTAAANWQARIRPYHLAAEAAADLYRRVFEVRLCELCGRWSDRLKIEHDHASGTVRGVVCERCNQLIGNVEAGLTEAEVRRVLDYLRASIS
jgi:hypothetical protein